MGQAQMKSNDNDLEKEAYDSVPYQSFPYESACPGHLWSIGKIFGMDVPDTKTARVLELGCASGGNLFPFAMEHPNSTCVGIDISPRQIEDGQKDIEALGLKNVKLIAEDMCTYDFGSEKFDYIVCHGIYSWVPAPVRDRIMEICKNHLSQNGIALVSYNTLPGWNSIRSLRDLMQYHTRNIDDPNRKIDQAFAALKFLSESTEGINPTVKQVVDNEISTLEGHSKSYFYHDHLEATNQGFYFHEFAQEIEKNDLLYVGDAELASMYADNLPPKTAEKLKEIKQIVDQEQYMDFIRNRRFRSSIITHKSSQLQRSLHADNLMDFNVIPLFENDHENSKPDDNQWAYTAIARGGKNFNVTGQESKVIYDIMARYVAQSVPISQIIDEAAAEVQHDNAKQIVTDFFKNNLLKLLFAGATQLRPQSYNTAMATVPEKPELWPLARYQIKQQLDQLKNPNPAIQENGKIWVSGRLHNFTGTDNLGLEVAHFCDGTHTQEQIIDAIWKQVEEGTYNASFKKNLSTDKQKRDAIGSTITKMMDKMRQSGIFVSQ